ncbi:MAG TPA: ATP-binding protein [Verrucomicrobiae bacterium]|nr:ATP-binding protein [Verrucomicrobiae bacterium]
MPTIDHLSKLFKALASKDLPAAARLAADIAANEEKKGHGTAAQMLRGSLVPNGTKLLSDHQGVVVDRDGQSAFLISALSRGSSDASLEQVVLRNGARKQFAELIKEFRHQSELQSLGIRRRSKLIFHGPPGCGKSFAAHALAHELHLPLFVVRFDSVIGAYLGQTASHLRQLFQFAETTRCVLLFDEIDALGKQRGSPTEVGELDRIVIALMQELELSELQGFLIATSNLPGSLDHALWRRFDLAFKFPAPTKQEITRFAASKGRVFGVAVTSALARRLSLLKNYAEIERAIQDEARRVALRRLEE